MILLIYISQKIKNPLLLLKNEYKLQTNTISFVSQATGSSTATSSSTRRSAWPWSSRSASTRTSRRYPMTSRAAATSSLRRTRKRPHRLYTNRTPWSIRARTRCSTSTRRSGPRSSAGCHLSSARYAPPAATTHLPLVWAWVLWAWHWRWLSSAFLLFDLKRGVVVLRLDFEWFGRGGLGILKVWFVARKVWAFFLTMDQRGEKLFVTCIRMDREFLNSETTEFWHSYFLLLSFSIILRDAEFDEQLFCHFKLLKGSFSTFFTDEIYLFYIN